MERDALIVEYLPLVKKIALSIFRRVYLHFELEDLKQWGALGLINAADSYDESIGVSFSAFSKRHIHGAIIDGIRSMDWGSRRVRRLARLVEDGAMEASDALKLEIHGLQLQSLSTPISEDETMCLEDVVFADSKSQSEHVEQQDMVQKVINCKRLTQREVQVLSLRYLKEHTQSEVATYFGCADSRVSKLESGAIKKVRKAMSVK